MDILLGKRRGLSKLIVWLLFGVCLLNPDAIFAKSKEVAVVDEIDLAEITIEVDQQSKRQAIVQSAIDLLGTPYVWGGNDLTGFDCSGLIEYIYKLNGLYMPRTTQQQQYFGESIALDAVKPGDLYFFAEAGDVYHVALALGNGAYIHSPSPGKVVSYGHIDRFEPQFAIQSLV